MQANLSCVNDERFRARVHAYCYMTNHVHLLIQVSDITLGKLMMRIASRYAHNVRQRFSTTGYLFERRYHAMLADADEYLLELLRQFISIPSRMVNTPNNYAWSSHHAYLGTRRSPG